MTAADGGSLLRSDIWTDLIFLEVVLLLILLMLIVVMMMECVTHSLFHIGLPKLEQHQLRVDDGDGDDGDDGDDDADGDDSNIMFH